MPAVKPYVIFFPKAWNLSMLIWVGRKLQLGFVPGLVQGTGCVIADIRWGWPSSLIYGGRFSANTQPKDYLSTRKLVNT